MRRFLRVRILLVLIALLLVPTLVLPFAERLRTEWARYWEPEAETQEIESLEERIERAFQSAMRSRRGPIVVPSSFSSLDPLNALDSPCPVFDFPGFRFGELTSAARAEKQANFLRAMEQVDLADIPLPAPPRGYPDAARWAELIAESEARKTRSTTPAADR